MQSIGVAIKLVIDPAAPKPHSLGASLDSSRSELAISFVDGEHSRDIGHGNVGAGKACGDRASVVTNWDPGVYR